MKSVWSTERLVLKLLDASFAERVLDFYRANAEFRRPWSPIAPADFLTLEHQHNRLVQEQALSEQGSGYTFWLFERSDTTLQQIVGFVGVRNIVRGAFQAAHIGYEIHHAFGGRGYMPEALGRVCQIAFDELQLHRLEANIIPRNQRSIRVAHKCGFEREGLARKYLKINGVWEDHEHHVLLNAAME